MNNKRVTIRMSEELYAELHKEAKKNGVSLNFYIIGLLKSSGDFEKRLRALEKKIKS